MTTLDWIIVAFTLGLGLYGFAQGFLVGVLSLVGFAAGAFLGSRLAPTLLSGGAASPYAPALTLGVALLAGGVLAATLERVGLALRAGLRLPGLATLDGIAGALLTACVALAIAWIAGAVALQTPGAGSLRRDVQRSLVLRRLNQLLPPSGSILHALARIDPLPTVSGPPVAVAPPPPGIARDRAIRRAAASTVRVLGTACGLGVEGSGWVVGPDLVVTNAHVVAGEGDTVVQPGGDGPRLRAVAVAFDPLDDIAVLRVGGLGLAPLPVASDARAGTPVGIVGYPENGPLTIRPGRVGDTSTAISQDAYGRGPVRREIVSLRGRVQPGNSGGPLLDAAGRVQAMVFATTVGGASAGGYAVPDGRVRAALAGASGPVSTGPCAR